MMMNEDLPEDLRKYLHNLERKIAQLEKDLKKESAGKEALRQSNKKLKKENEKLKKELARLKEKAHWRSTRAPRSRKEKTNSQLAPDTHHTG
jgi:regulator of replication initiation timing